MSLKVGNETLKAIKIKGNHTALIATNEETQDKHIITSKGIYPKTNTSIEKLFSVSGLTIKCCNIKAMGNYNAMSIRIFNSDTNKIISLSHQELITNQFTLNDKIPNYVKGVLSKLSLKMETAIKSNVRSQYTIKREIIPKTAISVLSVSCPLKGCNLIPIYNCFLCVNMLSSNRNSIIIKYHNYIKTNNIKVINEISTYNGFIATLSEKDREQLKTVNCRLNTQ